MIDMLKRIVTAAALAVVFSTSAAQASDVDGAVWAASNGRYFAVDAEVTVTNSATGAVVAVTRSNQFAWLGTWVQNAYVVRRLPTGVYTVSARYYDSSRRRWLTASCSRCVNSRSNGGNARVNLTVK
jgi:hypothetical protein